MEGAGMVQVGVQGGNQRRAFHDDAHAGMAVAMDATLVPLGATEEPFQIQIVTGKIGHFFADEQAGDKSIHGLGHRLPHRLVRASKASLEGSKQGPTPLHRAVVGVERGGHLAKVLHSLLHGLLLCLDVGNAPVDGVRQPLQPLLCRPPFFTSRFRCREDWISPRASAIFSPGGCKGPPWSSLSTPRTAAQ